MNPDPIARGRAAAHVVLAQDRRDRFAVLQGGGESTLRIEPAQVPAQMVRLAADDVRLLLVTLAQYGVPPRLAAIGDRIGEQVRPCLLPGADDANPHGIERPVS